MNLIKLKLNVSNVKKVRIKIMIVLNVRVVLSIRIQQLIRNHVFHMI
jgi:hypothetical protein